MGRWLQDRIIRSLTRGLIAGLDPNSVHRTRTRVQDLGSSNRTLRSPSTVRTEHSLNNESRTRTRTRSDLIAEHEHEHEHPSEHEHEHEHTSDHNIGSMMGQSNQTVTQLASTPEARTRPEHKHSNLRTEHEHEHEQSHISGPNRTPTRTHPNRSRTEHRTPSTEHVQAEHAFDTI